MRAMPLPASLPTIGRIALRQPPCPGGRLALVPSGTNSGCRATIADGAGPAEGAGAALGTTSVAAAGACVVGATAWDCPACVAEPFRYTGPVVPARRPEPMRDGRRNRPQHRADTPGRHFHEAHPPLRRPLPSRAARGLRRFVADDVQAAAAELDGWQQRYQQLTPGSFRACSRLPSAMSMCSANRPRRPCSKRARRCGYLSLALPHAHCDGGWFHGYAMRGAGLLTAGNGKASAMRTPRELDLLG